MGCGGDLKNYEPYGKEAYWWLSCGGMIAWIVGEER